ncbi:MAG: ion transporter [Candidatus Omnitrophota bacterium]
MSKHQRDKTIEKERWGLLDELDRSLDKPLIFLSFVWIFLIIVELNAALTPFLTFLAYLIWAVFIFDFILEITIAPAKIRYLKHNWPKGLSVLLPAFGVLRAARALRLLRAIRPINLLRLLVSLRQGINSLRKILGRYGLGYVVTATILVGLSGAAGMAHFESPAAVKGAGLSGGLPTYGDALWWTAMILTTMGSDYWPKTTEGRILSWFLALYAFSFFSYITANIASHFITARNTKP